MSNDRIDALRKAVDGNPDDVLLRLVLAESLVAAGETEEALDQYVVLLDQQGLPDDQFVPVGELAAADGLDLVAGVEGLPQLGDDEEVVAPDEAVVDGAGDAVAALLFVAVVF